MGKLLVLVLGALCCSSEGYFTPTTMRLPLPGRPPQRKTSKVPVDKPGVDLMSLQRNQKLHGSVVGMYEGGTCRKVFVDLGVTRPAGPDSTKHFPVFGMIRLIGRMANMTYAEGQKVEVYVSEVQKQGRLSVSLTPVYRRPEIGPDGRPLPVYQLSQLRVGMGLNGTVVGFSENYAFLDCGVLRDPREGQRPSRRPLIGKLYRLDLLERFALSPKLVGPKTEAVIKHGMSMQVYVKGVYKTTQEYALSVDPELTEEKVEALRLQRLDLLSKLALKQPLEKLLIGERRNGVITKVLEFGVKVGIGAKKTGYVPIDSVSEAYGKDIKDLRKVLAPGGRLEVEIEEVHEQTIDLLCVEIISVGPPEVKKGGKKKKPTKRSYDDDEDDDMDVYDYY